MDVVSVKLILREGHPLTSLLENDLIAIKQEDESQLATFPTLNTETEGNSNKVKVEPDFDNEIPHTSSPSDGELNEVREEGPRFVSVEQRADDTVKVKEEPTSDDETDQARSLPDSEMCEVKMEEEPDPFTFVSVKNEMEEGLDVGIMEGGLDVGIMEDELKCEVTVEEHEEGSDGLLNSTLEETNKSRKQNTYVCEVCGVCCGKNHVAMHPQTMEGKNFKCATFNSHKNDLRENKVIYTSMRPHSCKECGKTFLRKKSLYVHKILHTGRNKPHVCSICSKGFPSKAALKVHHRTHTGERPFSCDICGKQYKQIGHLTVHMRDHTGEKPFTCDICNVSFAQKKYLSLHIMLKHVEIKPHKCDKCSMSFAIKYHLQMHKRVHTGQKPHVFHTCNKGFTRRRNLYNHQHTHSLGNRFTCTECGEGFSHNRNLEQHKKSHTGLKLLHCDLYDRS